MRDNEFDLLVVDDEPEILRLLTEAFMDLSLSLQTADSVAAARERLAHSSFKVVLSDHNLTDGNGVDFLAEMRGAGTDAVPILMTGLLDVNVAVQAINRGKVFKFVTKPLDLGVLTQAVRRALEHWTTQREQARITRGIVEHSERLQRETAAKELRLQVAADRIRAEEETVEKQRARIEGLLQEIREAYLHTVTSLTEAIEAKDRYTRGHSERVYYYCSLMADALGLEVSSRRDLRFASVLHDLGKIGIPDSVLLKPGPLTPEEHRMMASHLTMTDDILKPLPFLVNVRRIIREHHERYDGSGYPEGLKGSQISLEGRILGVADAYDAMRSDRPYRRAHTRERAMTALRAEAGAHFCPMCSGALVFAIESHGEYEPGSLPACCDEKWEDELLRLLPAGQPVQVVTSITN